MLIFGMLIGLHILGTYIRGGRGLYTGSVLMGLHGISRSTILQFSVKYIFEIKRSSNCSMAVFMKTFYFFLLETYHI